LKVLLSVKIVFLVSAFIFISALSLSAQVDTSRDKNYFSYSGSIHYGALLGYKETDPVIIFTNPYSIDLSLRKHSIGKKRWEKIYNYPSTTFSLSYYNYGIPREYGEAYSATGSYEFNLFRSEKRNIWLTTGIGLVYSTHKFHAENNPFNKAISTDISYALQGSLRYDYNLTEKVILNASFSFKHFSNATLGIPNNGMNFPLVGIGMTYLPKKPEVNYKKDTLKLLDKAGHLTVSYGLALKKVLQIDDIHKIFTISLYYDKPVTKYNSILLGIDAFYNKSLYYEYVKKGLPYDETKVDYRQLALTLGQELFIGRIGVLVQGGLFVYQPHRFESNFYQKYGIKYHITKDFFLGSIVKVYTGTADYMEWVAGIRF